MVHHSNARDRFYWSCSRCGAEGPDRRSEADAVREDQQHRRRECPARPLTNWDRLQGATSRADDRG